MSSAQYGHFFKDEEATVWYEPTVAFKYGFFTIRYTGKPTINIKKTNIPHPHALIPRLAASRPTNIPAIAAMQRPTKVAMAHVASFNKIPNTVYPTV